MQRLCECLCGCLEAEGLSRPIVEFGGDRIERCLVELAEVGALIGK
jgi:hypothetical protein